MAVEIPRSWNSPEGDPDVRVQEGGKRETPIGAIDAVAEVANGLPSVRIVESEGDVRQIINGALQVQWAVEVGEFLAEDQDSVYREGSKWFQNEAATERINEPGG